MAPRLERRPLFGFSASFVQSNEDNYAPELNRHGIFSDRFEN